VNDQIQLLSRLSRALAKKKPLTIETAIPLDAPSNNSYFSLK